MEDLMKEYNRDIISDPCIQELMRLVVVNEETRVVDETASCNAILARIARDRSFLSNPRKKLICWINGCFYTQLTSKFWFDMHNNMARLLVVATVLEGCNFKSLGNRAPPSQIAIPSSIGYLYRDLMMYRSTYLQSDTEEYLQLYDIPAMKGLYDTYTSPWLVPGV